MEEREPEGMECQASLSSALQTRMTTSLIALDTTRNWETKIEGREINSIDQKSLPLAMNGYGREAIESFEEMLRIGIRPDDQTLTGVLSACSYSGMVDEGM